MIWTKFPVVVLIAVLSINSATALPAPAPSPAPSVASSSSPSFYIALMNTFLQTTKLTNCALDPTTPLPLSTLAPPSTGLTLKSITIGRGTQNYTCDTANPSSKPTATGATATLFDASCLASFGTGNDGDLLHLVPDALKPISLGTTDLITGILARASGQNIEIGKHYFTAASVPFFDLTSSGSGMDKWIAAKKEGEMPAPGKPGFGVTGDVAWLKLTGVEGGFKEVYRVLTAGGAAPETCLDMEEVFTVDYTSEYWFYG
ncbi:DUF3455 domain-containing protein [Aspergillus stella-maris]|uniref:DUF3455 domain-containing protein n=1 Tax=Aspergillus stella-maris TaxID=1810926 RepID=UPI003CCD0698